MDSWLVNREGSIWVFYQNCFHCEHVGEAPQHLTLKLTSQFCPIYFSFVHAKCTEQERTLLWSALLDDNPMNDPWLLAGDFNVIISEEEKRGVLPVMLDEGVELRTFMAMVGVGDAGFSGPRFTWCNNRGGHARIWKRLDRVLFNPIVALLGMSLLDVIRESWATYFPGRPLQRLAAKLRHTKQGIQRWSREHFGNIFDAVKWAESAVMMAETNFDTDPSQRHWGGNGEWLTDEDQISAKAVEFFRSLFSAEPCMGSGSILDMIPKVISRKQNAELEHLPSLEEIKEINSPHDFNQFRPISLCNFVNKVISKTLATRLSKVLLSIISPQQSGFVKSKQIFDNFLLAQELVSDIRRKNKGGNVVLNLDTAKAYDRVSWPFLLQVLRRFGFDKVWIDMISRIISNVWFSVIINSAPQGFFKSSRGLRQGGPISLVLFVISAEVFSRLLKSLGSGFTPFRVPPGCPPVTHLAYADDIIIFTSGLKRSVRLVIKALEDYVSVLRFFLFWLLVYDLFTFG
ncbi:uncharacterized protein LOC113767361 [Coffea eugenioides]|uniref:uncharacterized protein LOC113767361 n=1 Tax=Coffea eugenioides TaxID=49369 RepID=UPI000F60A699|nr:uncharacterized protein LOC113767361 [Coffea eugenioides]